MSKILILSSYYSPAYKGGGPIKSLQGISNVISNSEDVYVFCLNCDIDGSILDIPQSDKWINIDGINIFYSSKSNLIKNLKNIFKDNFDYLYLNSFFSFYFSIIPLIFNKFIGSIKYVVLAPRGELSSGAINIKNNKKKKYLCFSKITFLYNKNITWHATSELEKKEIEVALKKYLNIDNAKIKVAQNISFVPKIHRIKVTETKKLKLVFLSRISPKKNLKYALEVLTKCSLNIDFDIWGPLEDRQYWEECEKIIKNLPSNITVLYKGSIAPPDVPLMLSKYDLFFFPTLGENYGHVIAESLSVGTPLLISNTTPWINLHQHGVGKDIDLKNITGFVEFLEEFSHKTIQEKTLMRQKTLAYFSEKFCGENIINATYSLFKDKI